MALDANAMKALMASKIAIATAGGPLTTIDPVLQAISEAVCEHLAAHAEVDPAALPVPLTAPPGGGPVTGKGKIS